MFAKFFQRLVNRAVQEQASREKLDRLLSPSVAPAEGPPTNRIRHFVVHDALNGHYIEYTRRRYNPHGADDFAREIYIVQPGETLVDAISAVLVIMEK